MCQVMPVLLQGLDALSRRGPLQHIFAKHRRFAKFHWWTLLVGPSAILSPFHDTSQGIFHRVFQEISWDFSLFALKFANLHEEASQLQLQFAKVFSAHLRNGPSPFLALGISWNDLPSGWFYVWHFKILWQFGGVGYRRLPYFLTFSVPLCRHVDKLASGKSDGSSSARKQKFNPLTWPGALKYACHVIERRHAAISRKFKQSSNLYLQCWETMKHIDWTQGILRVWLSIRQDVVHGHSTLQYVWIYWAFGGNQNLCALGLTPWWAVALIYYRKLEQTHQLRSQSSIESSQEPRTPWWRTGNL